MFSRIGATEKMRFLQHDSQTRLQPVQTSLPVVDSIDPDTARRRLVKTAEQFRDRALAAAGFADKGDALSAANAEIEVRQHRPALRIGKRGADRKQFRGFFLQVGLESRSGAS